MDKLNHYWYIVYKNKYEKLLKYTLVLFKLDWKNNQNELFTVFWKNKHRAIENMFSKLNLIDKHSYYIKELEF